MPTSCKIADCAKMCDTYRGGAHGLCVMHYRRLQRNGDARKLVYTGAGFVSDHGYRILSRSGKPIPEHRLVVQTALGRPLESAEIVHHINHNKLDNRIENLEIVSRGEHIKMHDVRRFRIYRKKSQLTERATS